MNSATFLMITGLLLTMGGVGGIENSLTDSELAVATLLSVLCCDVVWRPNDADFG